MRDKSLRKDTPEGVQFCFPEAGALPRTERDPELRVKIVESTRDFADDPVVWRPSRHWWYIFLAGGIGWGNLSQIIWDSGFRNYDFSLMRRVCDILLSTAGKDSERVRWGLKWWNTTRPSRCWMVSCKWHSRFMVSIPNLNFSIFQPSKGSSAPMQGTSLGL